MNNKAVFEPVRVASGGERLRDMGFRLRMVLLVAVTLLPFVFYTAYQAWRDREQGYREALDESEQAARRSAHAVEQHVERLSTLIATLEPVVADERDNPAGLERHLRRIYPSIAGVASTLDVFMPEGHLIASGRPAPDVNIADRPYFQAAVQTRARAISEPLQMRQTGEWAVVIASPVVDRAGQVVAVITVATGLDLVDRILEANAPGAGARLALVSARGASVARWPRDATPRGGDLRRLPQFQGARSGQTFRGEVTTPDGGPRIGASVPVRTAPLQLYVSVPRDEALAAANAQVRSHLLIAAAMLVVSLAAALFLARGLAKPVLQLRRAVRELSRNGLSRPVALALATGGGEFAALAEDINRMSGRLAETQGRLRSIISLSSDWYWETDEAIRFTSVEGSFEGAPHEDAKWMLGKHYLQCGFVHADPDAHARTLAQRIPYRNEEVSLRDREGRTVRVFLVSGEPRFAPGGAFLGYRGACRDVTELRVGQRALAASESRFRELTELSSDWYWEQDEQFRFTYQSCLEGGEGVSDFTGFLGRRRWDAPAENMTEADWAAHRAVLERHEPFHDLEILRQDAAGRPHWGAVSGRPMFDESGRFTGYCGVGRNVTARKLAEGALQAERDRLARIIETMDEGLVILDTEGRFLRANGAAERILQAPAPALIGGHFGDASWMRFSARSGESARALRDMFARLAAGAPRVGPVVHELVLPDGAEKHLSMNGARLQGDDGAFAGVVVTFDDVSERKAHEREIVKLNEDLDRRVQERTAELRVAYRDMESFSYNVSHDLRAPLRAMAGFSSMLVEDFADELPREARRLLERVVKNADRMEQLIEGLLAFGRLSRQPLSLRRVSPREIVDDVLEELRSAIGQRRGVVRVGPLPDAWADPVLLRQVFANLVSNALKYSAKCESPRIEIGALDARSPGCTYFVRDNGAGFDMAHASRLFGMFQRLHSPSEFEGNGVGLAMVRRIVERHGGEIWAEAAPGEGATFFFRLDGQGIARDPSERPRGRVELREVARDGAFKQAS